MRFRKAFQYKLRPGSDQDVILKRMAGCKRFAWNKALELNRNRLEQSVPVLRYNDLAGLARLWKQSDEYGFLKSCYSQALQQGLKDLDQAFRDAFDPSQTLKHLPRFKNAASQSTACGFRKASRLIKTASIYPRSVG